MAACARLQSRIVMMILCVLYILDQASATTTDIEGTCNADFDLLSSSDGGYTWKSAGPGYREEAVNSCLDNMLLAVTDPGNAPTNYFVRYRVPQDGSVDVFAQYTCYDTQDNNVCEDCMRTLINQFRVPEAQPGLMPWCVHKYQQSNAANLFYTRAIGAYIRLANCWLRYENYNFWP